MSNGLIVDLFAGGGGASDGIRRALGRDPDIAINHDAVAVAMHAANHPATFHYCQDVWDVLPRQATKGRPVLLLWASPDCTHFSRAKGSAPKRDVKRRELAWVVEKWASAVRPAIICMENVEEFLTWGPLGDDGRVIKSQAGTTFTAFTRSLRRLGYTVRWSLLKACDHGAPTSRERLFLVARCDGRPIVWPEPTHGPGRLLPWRTAAEIIDWSIPCPSIFDRKRPLAKATLRRIAHGIKRYVIESARPFIVPIQHYNGSIQAHSIDEPVRTITAQPKGGSFALAVPHISTYYGEKRPGEVRGCGIGAPIRTQTTENRHALVAAFLAQHNLGSIGHAAGDPVSTITSAGSQQQIVAAHLIRHFKSSVGQELTAPAPTVMAGVEKTGIVASFLSKYYGQGNGSSCDSPVHTLTAKDRMGLVTVRVDGQAYYFIADIGMRMLKPRELYRAQGFDDTYTIDFIEIAGRRITIADQVRLCGNSVCPPVAEALVRANVTGVGESDAALRHQQVSLFLEADHA